MLILKDRMPIGGIEENPNSRLTAHYALKLSL